MNEGRRVSGMELFYFFLIIVCSLLFYEATHVCLPISKKARRAHIIFKHQLGWHDITRRPPGLFVLHEERVMDARALRAFFVDGRRVLFFDGDPSVTTIIQKSPEEGV